VVEFDGEFFPICSGTLIASDVFLTAAHCTDFLPSEGIALDDVWVSFDPSFDQSSPLLPGTADINEEYSSKQSDPHDIAVIVLDDPATGITPARLPRQGLLADLKASGQLKKKTYTAVGYGTVRDSRKKGFQGIQDNSDRRFATQTANSLTGAWLKLSMNQATGDGGTCYGDSGGPHFLGGPASNLIVSLTVTGDAVCKASDVTYRLDTASARSYLDDFVTLP
jgi:secreted trypsin-like serine protease